MSKVHINTNPAAQRYAAPAEKIIEYTAPDTGIGGLIKFVVVDGVLHVDLYRHDPSVEISTTA